MNRQPLVDALKALSDEEFLHLAVVCNDIANRLPGQFTAVGKATRTLLDLPEPEPVADAVAPVSGAGDKSAGLTGVAATAKAQSLV